MKRSITLTRPKGESLSIGAAAPLAFMLGPCVIESREFALRLAEEIATCCERLAVPFVFKASYDKANRTSAQGYRGLGMDEGLAVLAEVKKEFNCCVISDVHAPEQARPASEVLDILQVPAFLCRQTDLLEAVGRTGKPVMIKKGQFLHPEDMRFAAQKVAAAGSDQVLLCERGTCFGYRELIVDFRALAMMADQQCPVVFDATHSVQIMGGAGGSSGGQRRYVPLLALAAVAVGCDAVFMETHPTPETAPSDGPNMVPLDVLPSLLKDLKSLSELQLESRASALV